MRGLINVSVTHFLISEGACDILSQKQLDLGVKDIEMVWHIFFDIVIQECNQKKATKVDPKTPLSMKILNFSPEHPVCKSILYIFAMDTFIPKAIQNANLHRDINAVPHLGPLAMFLAEIVYIAQRARKTDRHQIRSLQSAPFEAYLGCAFSNSFLAESELFEVRTYLLNLNFLSVSYNPDVAI